MFTGVLGELHDHPTRFGGPAAGYSSSQREARARGEEEPAYCGECREPEKAQGNRGQNPRGPLQLRGKPSDICKAKGRYPATYGKCVVTDVFLKKKTFNC